MNLLLDYTASQRQQLLHTSTAARILYGGAAGGGKSHGLRWHGYMRCLLNPGLQAYLFRRTQRNLLLNHILRFASEVPQELGKFAQNRQALEFYNGSVLWCCYCEAEQDVENYQGAEIHLLLLDEAALFTPAQIAFLRSRIRVGAYKPKQPQYLPQEVMVSNPGGPSHEFLKRTMVHPAPPESEFDDYTGCEPGDPPRKCIYIPARMSDNAYIDSAYRSQFADMPEHKRKMFVDGDWDAIEGAFFDCFDKEKNVIPVCKVPDHWTKFRAVDWGSATPFSVGWWAVADGETALIDRNGGEHLLPEGCLVRYREWYGCKPDASGASTNKGLRLSPEQVAAGIRDRERETPAYTVIDPSAARRETGPSVRELLGRAGIPNIAADNNRVTGWQQVYSRLNDRMLVVMESCRDFIRTMPILMPKESDPEDIMKGGEDHVGDEVRYACMSRPIVKKETTPEETTRGFFALMKQAQRNDKRRKRERVHYGS